LSADRLARLFGWTASRCLQLLLTHEHTGQGLAYGGAFGRDRRGRPPPPAGLRFLVAPQAHYNIDTIDGVALRRRRHICDADVGRHVDEPTSILEIEMLMV